jgi:2-hydroxychromene-2-carboxylate isomerase
VRPVVLYVDFLSPYSYFAIRRLHELPRDVQVEARPVLLAGLLQRFGQKGPAEIESKRRYAYRWCIWWAHRHGIPFRFPASHPFNPLHHLRLALAAGPSVGNVVRIFEAIWTTGADAADPDAFATLARELKVDAGRLAALEVKDALRANTEQAIVRGVFGVPTWEVDGELFWGSDAKDFLNAFLADPGALRNDEMRRADALPVGAARKP